MPTNTNSIPTDPLERRGRMIESKRHPGELLETPACDRGGFLPVLELHGKLVRSAE